MNPDWRPAPHFLDARRSPLPEERLREIRRRAAAFREEMLDHAAVPFYRSFDLVRVPYPTRYGLRDATTALTPIMHIVNRLFIVQFRSGEALRTLLISPSDVVGNRDTPFFRHMRRKVKFLGKLGENLLAPTLAHVEGCLQAVGLRPETVDYLAYDHLHTQDLRRWLGPGGVFPRARLIVQRQEWASTHALLPTQAYWYCPGGTQGIPPDRILEIEGDGFLGEGVAILHTPGHTEGNMSFVVRTPEGLMVTSENGVGPDAYAPGNSRIPGLRRYARETGAEVVLNGNTLEGSVDQYLSMVQEREVAGPSARNPDFPNVVCSSEFSAWWAFPGLRPTFEFGPLAFGTVQP